MCDLIYGIYGLYLPAWMSMSAPVFLPRWCRCPVLLLPLRCTRLIQVDKRGLHMMKRRIGWTRSIRKDVILWFVHRFATGNNRRTIGNIINILKQPWFPWSTDSSDATCNTRDKWHSGMCCICQDGMPCCCPTQKPCFNISMASFYLVAISCNMSAMSTWEPCPTWIPLWSRSSDHEPRPQNFAGLIYSWSLSQIRVPPLIFPGCWCVLWDPKVRHEGLFTLPC